MWEISDFWGGIAQSSLFQPTFEVLLSVSLTLTQFMGCYLCQAKCRLLTGPSLNAYQRWDCMPSLADPRSLHASLFLYWSGYLTLGICQSYFEFTTVFPCVSVFSKWSHSKWVCIIEGLETSVIHIVLTLSSSCFFNKQEPTWHCDLISVKGPVNCTLNAAVWPCIGILNMAHWLEGRHVDGSPLPQMWSNANRKALIFHLVLWLQTQST